MSTGWLVLGLALLLSACAWLMGMAFASYARDSGSKLARTLLGRNWAERSAMSVDGEAGRANIAFQGRATKILALVLLAAGLLLAFGVVPVDFIDPITL